MTPASQKKRSKLDGNRTGNDAKKLSKMRSGKPGRRQRIVRGKIRTRFGQGKTVKRSGEQQNQQKVHYIAKTTGVGWERRKKGEKDNLQKKA